MVRRHQALPGTAGPAGVVVQPASAGRLEGVSAQGSAAQRRATRGNGKLQLYSLVKQAFGRELYLQCPDAQHRRLWTKLRAGALELRVETGRWERVSVGGRQVPVPRYLRECELCWAGVGDERHFLFRCASLESVRRTFWRAISSHGNMSAHVAEAIAKLKRDERLVATEEDEMVLWMMSVEGLELSMSLAAKLWKRQKGVRVQLQIDRL